MLPFGIKNSNPD